MSNPFFLNHKPTALIIFWGLQRGTGSPNTPLAEVPNGILSECAEQVDRAFCLDYRLSSAPPFKPVNPYPAALIDAVSGYRYLLDQTKFQAKNIIVSGDSAGGHLAVALVRYLIELNDPSLPLPGAVLLLSPTVDWACTHDKLNTASIHRNAKSDFVSIVLQSGYTARGLLGNLPETEISQNPYLSPASLDIKDPSGLFTHFPPTCMITGGAEQTLDPMHTLRDRIIRDTSPSNVLYLEYEDAFHDFLLLSIVQPERSQALKSIREWLQNSLSQV
jgi:acetyl esterase/lipase